MAREPAQRFNGWKAIADYLGRDVRTVQRWRDERGMPVHRVPGGKSGSVFADAAELDAWLLQRTRTTPGGEPASATGQAVDDVGSPHAIRVLTASPPGRGLFASRRYAYIALGLAIVGAAGLAIRSETAPARIPARLNIVGGRIVAHADDESILWTLPAVEQPGGVINGSIVDKVSLMDTMRVAFRPGETDLVPLLSISRAATAPHDGTLLRNSIYRVSPAGRLIWTFYPSDRLTFGGREFGGPWRIYAWAALPGPKASVWVSFIDHVWWPSFVTRLDAAGHGETAFVNSGHIAALAPVTIRGATSVLAGGVNNEYRSAALAVLDPDAEGSTSPQGARTAFACDNCPAGSPQQYLLFPRLEVVAASGVPFEFVDMINATPRAPIEVAVRDSADLQVRAVYRFSEELVPESVAMSDRYWELHRELFRTGKLDHSPEECLERTRGVTIRSWQRDTGWRDVRVLPTFAPPHTP